MTFKSAIIKSILILLLFITGLILFLVSRNSIIVSKSIVITYLITTLVVLLIVVFLTYYIYIKGKKKEEKVKNVFLDWLTFIPITVMTIFTVFTFIISPSAVNGNSMNNTLNDKDRVLVLLINYKPKLEDIAVINVSAKYGVRNSNYVKRIKAVPGDRIAYSLENKLMVNDLVITNNAGDYYYKRVDDTLLSSVGVEFVQNTYYRVKSGYYVVLGDNTENSQDSRSLGAIEKIDIKGKVVYKIFPFGQVK